MRAVTWEGSSCALDGRLRSGRCTTGSSWPRGADCAPGADNLPASCDGQNPDPLETVATNRFVESLLGALLTGWLRLVEKQLHLPKKLLAIFLDKHHVRPGPDHHHPLQRRARQGVEHAQRVG